MSRYLRVLVLLAGIFALSPYLYSKESLLTEASNFRIGLTIHAICTVDSGIRSTARSAATPGVACAQNTLHRTERMRAKVPSLSSDTVDTEVNDNGIWTIVF